MSQKRRLIDMLAPTAPSCFADRLSWLEWLYSLAESEGEWSHGGGKLIVYVDGQPRFNYTISFCSDCDRAYRSRMLKEGRCNPSHLREIAPQEATCS